MNRCAIATNASRLRCGVDNQRTHTTAYAAELDALRKSGGKTGRWQRLRARVVKRQPFCAMCDVAYTEIVDHIVPAGVAVQQAQDSALYQLDRYAGYFIETNLQGLCRVCHYTKTLADKAHTGVWPDVIEKHTLTKKQRHYSF